MDVSSQLALGKRINHAIQIAKEYFNPEGVKIRKYIDKMLYKFDSKEMSLSELVKREM